MASRRVSAAGRSYLISDDDAPHPEQLWWAVLRTRVVDELTGDPPRHGVRVTTTTPHCVPRAAADGIVGLAARPRDVSAALVTPGALTAEVSVPGYLSRSLDAAIDAARRTLPGGAALGATSLTVVPDEAPPREQFVPGRGVTLEREAASDREQFTLVSELAPSANDVVPITDRVAPARTGTPTAAGVPIVLPDQPLHRDTLVTLRGRASRAAGFLPANAFIGIDGYWWTYAEAASLSNPPHGPRLAALPVALSFDHAAGAPVQVCTLGAPGTMELRNAARRGDREVQVWDWATLSLTGNEVLEFELAGSTENELVVSDGYTAPPDAALPATVRLRTPLAFPHRAGAPVSRRSITGYGWSGALEREAQAGDRVLFLDAVRDADEVLVIEMATGREELRRTRRLPRFAPGREVPVATDGSFEFPPLARIAQVRLRARYDTGSEVVPPIDLPLEYGGDNRVDIQFT